MDRRSFLQVTAIAAAASAAQAVSAAAPAAPSTPPAFPPIDAHSVWLVGDGTPPDPAAFATRLSSLVQGREKIRDSYLVEGAVGELEKSFATMLGKEDCAFFATGTQANNVALRVLCGEHRRALVQHESHVYRDESDSVQRLSGINLVPLATGRATPALAEFEAAIDEAEKGPYPLKIGAISLEIPVRRADGELVPLPAVAAIAKLARAHDAKLHLDGARLLLAPPSLDLEAYAGLFDTVYVSLYKYLGAPFGAVLAGSREHIAEARELRHLYGGTIYQGWVPALAALDVLATFPANIAKAHAGAQQLFSALEAGGKVRVRANPNASNIHFLEMPEAFAAAAFERGRNAGVRVGRWKDGVIPFYVNETFLRRPVEEYVRLFQG